VETLRAAAALPTTTAEAVPAALHARLLALRPSPASAARSAPAPRLPLWRGIAEWAMAAAVLVAVALAGFGPGRAASGESAEAVPAALHARLLALRPSPASAARSAPAQRLPLWRGIAEWAMAAAVLVAVAIAGFDLGSATSEQSAEIVASAADDEAAAFQVAL